jgi:hypothetical protein
VTRALAFVLAVAALTAPAAAASKRVLVLNAGTEAIFSLRVDRGGATTPGPDVLGFAAVIDVSSGRDVSIDVDPATCSYDLVASYRDGHTQTQTADLCSVDRVRFDH